jgi:hypothetical protein
MDGLGNSLGLSAANSDPKAAVMNQVRQEAAMQNAKQLIEVSKNSTSTAACVKRQNAPHEALRKTRPRLDFD